MNYKNSIKYTPVKESLITKKSNISAFCTRPQPKPTCNASMKDLIFQNKKSKMNEQLCRGIASLLSYLDNFKSLLSKFSCI